jgi:hypothetical protein
MTTTANSKPFENKPERKVVLTFKIHFNRELELSDWGPFCKRHGLMGGLSQYDADHWVSMKGHVPYAEVDSVIRNLNLDPMVERARITHQEDETV